MTFGLGRLGASFGKLGAGNSVDGPALSLTAPVLAFVDATDPSSDNTQDVLITLTAPEAGDEVVTNAKIGGFSTESPAEFEIQDIHTLSGPEIAALEATRTLTLSPDGAYSLAAFHKRSSTYSGRSNVPTKTITTATTRKLEDGTTVRTLEDGTTRILEAA